MMSSWIDENYIVIKFMITIVIYFNVFKTDSHCPTAYDGLPHNIELEQLRVNYFPGISKTIKI